MAVGLKVGPIFYKIGTGSFLFSFFSTIVFHLEFKDWGSKFPYLMKNLYYKNVKWEEMELLKKEIEEIQDALQYYKPSEIIWDIGNLEAKPPWGANIAERITDLSNYFQTSDGKDLFEVFYTAIDAAQRVKRDMEIKNL